MNYWLALKLARIELEATEAPYVVFSYSEQWFEICKGKRRAKRVCGARKKTGERCRSKLLLRGSKCKFHGGLSTGAKTPEGKARSIAAMLAGRLKKPLLDNEQIESSNVSAEENISELV